MYLRKPHIKLSIITASLLALLFVATMLWYYQNHKVKTPCLPTNTENKTSVLATRETPIVIKIQLENTPL